MSDESLKKENEEAVVNEDMKQSEEVNEKEMTAKEKKAAKKKWKKKKDPLKEAKEEIAKLNEKILRLHAEYDNFRKRTAKDLRNSRESGVVDTIMPFLQVYDHMKMASMSIENGDNLDAIRQGVSMIVNEFKNAIADLSVEEVDAIGSVFDPNLHSAVAHEPSDEVPEGNVLKQWSVGYKKGDRLIKPAKVVVSSGPKKEEVADENEGGE